MECENCGKEIKDDEEYQMMETYKVDKGGKSKKLKDRGFQHWGGYGCAKDDEWGDPESGDIPSDPTEE